MNDTHEAAPGMTPEEVAEARKAETAYKRDLFMIDEVVSQMPEEKRAAIRRAAERITGEPQESDEDAAQLIMEEFARPHANESTEETFDKIDADAAAEAFSLLPPEEQAARKAREERAAELLHEAFSKESLEEIKQSLAKIGVEEGPDAFHEASIYLQQHISIILEKVQEFLNSESFLPIREELSQYWDIVNAWTGAAQVENELAPYIQDVMKNLADEAEKAHLSLEEYITFRTDSNGNPDPITYKELLQKAKNLKIRREASKAREAAKEQGAIMSIGGRLAPYSEEGFENTLDVSMIFRLPDVAPTGRRIFDRDGRLNEAALQTQENPQPVSNILETLGELNIAFLWYLNKMAIEAVDAGDETAEVGRLKLYLPSILRELSDPRSYSKDRDAEGEDEDMKSLRYRRFMDMIAPLDALVGKTPHGLYYRVAAFESYDPRSEVITFSIPYLVENYKAIKALKGDSTVYLNRLMYATVVNEKNMGAVEVANRILNGLVQRGDRPTRKTYKSTQQKTRTTKTTKKSDGTIITERTEYATELQDQEPQTQPDADKDLVIWSCSFKTIIRDCPQLKKELAEIDAGTKVNKRTGDKTKPANKTAAYNAKLASTFEAAIRIIIEKSDAPNRYVDLTIGPTYRPRSRRTGELQPEKFRSPTKSTLTDKIVITHHGRSKDFTGPNA